MHSSPPLKKKKNFTLKVLSVTYSSINTFFFFFECVRVCFLVCLLSWIRKDSHVPAFIQQKGGYTNGFRHVFFFFVPHKRTDRHTQMFTDYLSGLENLPC